MNSKERVMSAIHLKKYDYVPSDFHGTANVLERLFEYFHISGFKPLMKKLGTDMIDIRGVVDPFWIGPEPKVKEQPGGEKLNYLGFVTKKINTVFGELEEHSRFIFDRSEELEEVERFHWPKVEWFDFSNMNQQLDELKDYAIMASGASVWQHVSLVRGIDNLLCDMMIFPEMAELLMDKYTNFYLDYYSRMFEVTQGRIDILRIADDLGMQDRLLVSPELFRKYVKPRIKKIADMAHSYGVKLMFHSCGSIVEFIDDLIEVGVDVLDPIQTRASGMDPENLKKRFGKRICFHGSIDTQYTLPKGTPKQIEAEVAERMEVFGTDCGFIIAPSHTVQPDVPTENIVALYDSINKYR